MMLLGIVMLGRVGVMMLGRVWLMLKSFVLMRCLCLMTSL